MSSALEDVVATLTSQINSLGVTLTDFAIDFKAAIDKLQADIAAGGVKPETLAALTALSGTVDAVVVGLKSLDSQAEDISGKPTP